MIIAISGTPGVGKSKVAELLARKLGYRVIEVNRLLGIPHGKEVEVSISKLEKTVEHNLSDNVVIVSHLAHFLHDKRIKYFFVLRCEPPVLIKRLRRRGYNNLKIYDNVMFEAIDGTYLEASKLHRNIIHIDNTKNIDETVNAILFLIKKGKVPTQFSGDYSKYIISLERALKR